MLELQRQVHGIHEENMLEVDTASALAAIDEELSGQDALKVDKSGSRSLLFPTKLRRLKATRGSS
jgi:hypothetical protein